VIREAEEEDTAQICALFRETYGADYAFPQFFDPSFLKKRNHSAV